jgi:hypothetical protein
MSVAGMSSGQFRQADDRIPVDIDQASGLSDAAALGEVLEHGAGFLLGQVGVEQRCALALGEAVLAGVAVEQADVILFAVAVADGEIPGVALAVGGAIGILAAEAREIVHGWKPPGRPGRTEAKSSEHDASDITTPVPHSVFSSSGTPPTRSSAW